MSVYLKKIKINSYASQKTISLAKFLLNIYHDNVISSSDTKESKTKHPPAIVILGLHLSRFGSKLWERNRMLSIVQLHQLLPQQL